MRTPVDGTVAVGELREDTHFYDGVALPTDADGGVVMLADGGMPALEPVQRISRLPEVTAAASYIGLNCVPVVHGRLTPGFLTNGLDGSLGEYFSQNKLTVTNASGPATEPICGSANPKRIIAS